MKCPKCGGEMYKDVLAIHTVSFSYGGRWPSRLHASQNTMYECGDDCGYVVTCTEKRFYCPDSGEGDKV